MRILKNAIVCLKCNELVVSTHVHDFRYCKCKAVAVDGGNEYLKRTGSQWDYIEACAYDAASSQNASELEGKFLVFAPDGHTNPRTIFDRQEDAQAIAQQMAEATKQKLWYVAKLSTVRAS